MDKNKISQHFQELEVDYLYHLGLDSSSDLKQEFGQIKYVVLTRSFADADYFANQFTQAYYKLQDVEINCKTIAKDERYHIYKVANTLIISHGLGFPSMLICLNEVVKLLWHAGVENYQFIRLSPGGGIGTAANSLVVANEAVNYKLEPEWSNIEFGEYFTYNTQTSDELVKKLFAANPNEELVHGKILSSNSFYNGQARLNGATEVSYSRKERDEYLQRLHKAEVKGIDMESGCFIAFCKNFAIPSVVVLAALSDRLSTHDSIEASLNFDDQHMEIAIKKATKVIINYILN